MRADQGCDTNQLMRTFLTLLGFALALFASFSPANAANMAASPVARQGVLDLRSHDFTAQPTIDLTGEWGFFWRELRTAQGVDAAAIQAHNIFIPVPGYWSDSMGHPAHGFATYALTILLPPAPIQQPLLALRVFNTNTAIQLWVDGQDVYSSGKVGTDLESEVPRWRPSVVTFAPKANTVTVVMHLSNFHYRKGGVWRPISLGLVPDVVQAWSQHDQFDLMLMGGLLIIGLGQLGLFVLRPSDRSTLYFGLFCGVMLLRIAFVGDHLVEQRWPDFNFEWARKFEYLALSLGPLILCYYFREVFGAHAAKRWLQWVFAGLLTFSALCSITILLLPVHWYNHLVPAMQLSLLVCTVWSFIVIGRAALQKDKRAYSVLLSALVFVVGVVNDVLYSRGMIMTDYVAPLGFAFFLLVQTYLTARDYARSHQKTAIAEAAQRRGFALLANVQKNAGMGIWQWYPTKDEALWSQTVYEIFHLPLPDSPSVAPGFAGRISGSATNQLIHPDDREKYFAEIAACLRQTRPGSTDFRIVRADGEVRNLYTEVNIERGAQGEILYLYGYLQDVTEKKRVSDALERMNADLENLVALRTDELTRTNAQLLAQNGLLEKLSITDRLTGLNNRLRLDQTLEEELQRLQRYGDPFALVLLDVDKFKSVNDDFGHAVGDQVLVELATILTQNTRAIDLVGRWGGEEFLIICRETTQTGACALAEKLREAVAAHAFPAVGSKTASFGVTAAIAGDTISKMMARADAALYCAKAGGRNRVEFQ